MARNAFGVCHRYPIPFAVVVLVWSAVAGGAGERPPRGDSADGLFDPLRLLEVRLEMGAADWERLRREHHDLLAALGPNRFDRPEANPYRHYPAEVTINGERIKGVQVRKRGFLGSASFQRPSLGLRFDKPGGPGQFHGLSRLALNNNLQDPSQVHQVFAYQVFRAAGVPAPRCNLARVFVNGRDLGIYSHVEAIQEEFLRRIFGEDSGNLYEGQISDFRPQWIKTFERKNPDALRGRRDLDAVVEALQSPADTLLARVGAKVDVEAYLTFWAVECVLGHWDSYSNNGNNFFVYHRAATDRFQFIPWGADSVLGDPDPFSRHKKPAIVTASMILPQRLYQLPAVRQQYFDRVRQVLREAWDEDHLLAETRRWESLVRPHLQVKTNHFEEALAKVRRFIKDRRGVLKGELEGPTPAWTWPLKKNGCLEKSGWVEAAFNTTWEGKPASNEVVQSSASLTVVRDGDQRRFWLAGVTAGPARDPRNEGSPAIAVIGLQVLRGRAVVPVVIIEPELFRPRARLPIDCFGVAGVLLESQLAAFNLKTPALLLGTLELDEAGQKPGARIKGRFQADIYGLLE